MQSSQVDNNVSDVRPLKRKSSPNKDPLPKKNRKRQDNIQRRITNPDAETCWLNSCLQLVLTALDFKGTICPTGSVLWQTLLWGFLFKLINKIFIELHISKNVIMSLKPLEIFFNLISVHILLHVMSRVFHFSL